MRFISALVLASSLTVVAGEGLNPKVRPDLVGVELNPEWLALVERIRAMPRPGEIRNTGLNTDLTGVYELADDTKAEIKKTVEAYDAELMKRAAKWHDEQKTLRAEFESKVVQSLPESKKETAKKLLEISHAHFATPLDRDDAFKKEFAKRVADLRDSRAKMNVDQLNAAREEMQAWIKSERRKLADKDEAVINAMKAQLAPDEAERLQHLVRVRPDLEASSKEPAPDSKAEKPKKSK